MNSLIAKAVIIDDELPIRRTLRGLLASIPELELIGEAGNVTEALDLINDRRPDLIFLDIKMPLRSGFDLLDELTGRLQFFGVIFVSGYPDEALTAVQKAAPHLHTDFLVKPVDPKLLKEKVRLFYEKWKTDKTHEAELTAQLEAALSQMDAAKEANSKYLIFQNYAMFHRIKVSDIMYCESANRQINIFCSKQEHLNVPNLTLDILEKMLPQDRFIRIGKSHILNKKVISYIEKGSPPVCRLVKGDCVREIHIYASNIDKVEKSYS